TARRSAIRNATSESCRISLSVSCDTSRETCSASSAELVWTSLRSSRRTRCLEPIACSLWKSSGLGRDPRPGLEMLVRRAVLALGERRPLAGLALPRRRPATGDAAVKGAGLDLRLDERTRRRDAFADRPRDLCLRGDREVAADVLEERPLGLREVERIGREALHRLLARVEHLTAVFEAGRRVDVGVDKVLDRAV